MVCAHVTGLLHEVRELAYQAAEPGTQGEARVVVALAVCVGMLDGIVRGIEADLNRVHEGQGVLL